MRRILISTTALSVALTQIASVPAIAQTLTEDGSVIGNDGSILCVGTPEAPCDLDAVLQQLDAQLAEEAAAAEAAAQAQAEAEAAAAAEAEAQRAAEEAAAAEAAAQAQAEAEAAAAAEAEAQRAAEEAAAVEAAAQAQAEAEAAAAAEAEAQRAAEEAAAAEAAAQAQAEAEAAAAAEGEPAAGEDPTLDAAMEEILSDDGAATDAPAPDATAAPAEEGAILAPEAVDAPSATIEETDAAAGVDPGTDGGVVDGGAMIGEPLVGAPLVAPDGTPIETFVAEEPADLIDPAATEVPSEAAIESLSTLLAAPESEAAPGDVVLEAPVSDAAAAAGAEPIETTEGEAVVIAPSQSAETVVVEEITAEAVRSSGQDFAAPATANLRSATRQRDDGLTDLQKFGLIALGALAVGAIINANRDQVVSNTGDRVVVRRGDGNYYVYKDDDTLLRRPGSTVRTETFRDGSTRTIVERADGTQVVTIRDATGRVLRRATYDGYGREIVLIDDLYPEERIDVRTLPQPRARVIPMTTTEEDALLRARMAALDAEEIGRTFSLRQIREIPQVRRLAATVDVNNITFDSGSAAIKPTQAESLAALGRFMQALIKENPNEMFLIEGHTDAVGAASLNLTLSDRRAESVALALTEYFGVPPENMVVQGYGESELRIQTQQSERQNRRVAVRIITPLLRTADLR